MKKISCFSLIFLLFSLFFLQNNVVFAENVNNEYVCIANFCYLYSAPDFTSEKIVINGELLKINHKDIVTIKLEDGNIVTATDANNMLFYQVESFGENTFDSAYIFSDFVTENTNTIEIFPEFNATINTPTVLYQVNGETIEPTDIVIAKSERVYLFEGYNEDLTHNRVAVKIDNQLVYGYILTDYISPDGFNPAIIYAATIALACIGIIMALLFMKNKKKKVS